MSKLTDQFKKTAFRVEYGQAEAIQNAMFALGFKWIGGGRWLMTRHGIGWLYVNKDCRMLWTGAEYCAPDLGAAYVTKPTSDLYAAVALHKEEKKALKKASRKRKQLRKQGWIIHTPETDAKPDLAGRPVTILLRGGEHRKGVWSWGTDCDYDCHPVAYKFNDVVSQEDMVADIVKASNGVEIDKDGFTIWNGGECPVEGGALVLVKLRAGQSLNISVAAAHRWNNAEGEYQYAENDIIAYKVVQPLVAEKVTMEEMLIETQTPFTGYTHGEAGSVVAAPDTNPKKQYGLASIPLNMWSPLASAYGAVSLYNGSLKYGRCNYMASPVEASIYIAAAMRHLTAWAEGEEFDPADGCPNLGGVLANIAILLEARAVGTLIDDRQMTGGYLKEREMLKALVKSLQATHAGKDPRHYTIKDNKE